MLSMHCSFSQNEEAGWRVNVRWTNLSDVSIGTRKGSIGSSRPFSEERFGNTAEVEKMV
jgi:hypothetical protein